MFAETTVVCLSEPGERVIATLRSRRTYREMCDTDGAGFTVDSTDPTLCTDEIDDIHIPQISDDAGSEGE